VRVLARAELERLFDALGKSGRPIIGPTVRAGAIVMDRLDGPDALPTGFVDSQGPGRYRLAKQGDATFEGYVVGPHSPKQMLSPAREVLYTAERRADGKLGFSPRTVEGEGFAFLGLRACDLAAMRIQAEVSSAGPFDDPRPRARREGAVVVAVNCTEPGDLCFCASTGTGPRVREGADLVLTERGSDFLLEAQTEAGRALLEDLPTGEATAEDEAWVDDVLEKAAGNMGREVDTEALPEILFGRLDHPRWSAVADRCLACGNCTSVCPTCFCTTTEDPSTLDGNEATRERIWDSCFTEAHAYIHGGTFRPDVEDRYRQWLTHKVGSWVAQFGSSGCVGCGRCIAWCPVGIDLTQEIAALREGEGRVDLPSRTENEHHVDEDLTPHPAEVTAVTRESDDVVTLHLETDRIGDFSPGQFCQLSLPGIGEVPISISGHDGTALEHTIRAVGATTTALCAVGVGEEVGLRGPYGRPWPMEALKGRPVVVVGGGIGLAPLRGALREMLGRPEDYPRIILLYGAREPGDALFVREMLGWLEDPRFELHITVDHATPAWRGHVGVVTRLLDAQTVPEGASAMICGPEIMMRYTIEGLSKLGLPDERIWVTMERHMECATGFCGRCQYGPYFVCKDGPVFSFDQIRFLFGKKGF
jgi:NAD(P)H-flavin reductase/ferredoxin